MLIVIMEEQICKGGRRRRQRAPVEAHERGEHIMRERLRRDDMTEKFSALEKLLPWRPKRDRTAIVEDAINYVTEMQGVMQTLEQRLQTSANPSSSSSLPPPQIHVPESSTSTANNQLDIEVTCAQSGEIFVGLRCNNTSLLEDSRPSFMTAIAAAFEELRLDIIQCSFCKSPSHIFCVIVAKVQHGYMAAGAEEISRVLQYRLALLPTCTSTSFSSMLPLYNIPNTSF